MKLARCESCGVPWLKHLGIMGTCAELAFFKSAFRTAVHKYADAKDQIKKLERKIKRLEARK